MPAQIPVAATAAEAATAIEALDCPGATRVDTAAGIGRILTAVTAAPALEGARP
jgi:hypothetical protein